MAPEPIPLAAFAAPNDGGSTGAEVTDFALRQIGSMVARFGLLRPGIDTVVMHRLTQWVISDLLAPDERHQLLVRDPGESTAAVLTGSTNFTRTDTGTNDATGPALSRGNNLNHVLILKGDSAAGQYLREFMRLRSGTFGDLHERVEPKLAEFRLGRIRVKPLFSPRHGPEMEIMKQLMVIDGRLTIIGSFNYTEPANTLNDENIIVLGDLEETSAQAETAQRQLATFALTEIDRIITDLAVPV